MRQPRFIVYEQEIDEYSEDKVGRINDVFGPFYSWNKANALCKKLQSEHPHYWYGIRELLHGNTWLKSKGVTNE